MKNLSKIIFTAHKANRSWIFLKNDILWEFLIKRQSFFIVTSFKVTQYQSYRNKPIYFQCKSAYWFVECKHWRLTLNILGSLFFLITNKVTLYNLLKYDVVYSIVTWLILVEHSVYFYFTQAAFGNQKKWYQKQVEPLKENWKFNST